MYVTARGEQLRLSAAPTYWTPDHVAGSTVYGTSGNDAFYAKARDKMIGGLGDDHYYVWVNNYTLTEQASAGVDTLYSNIYGSVTLAANVENLILEGEGSTAGVGNSLNNILIAGKVGAWLNGAGGNDVLAGGTGRDVFDVRAGSGSDAIQGFQHGVDLIRLDGYGIASFAALKSAMTQVGNDVSIGFANGETLVIRDVTIAQLGAVDFRLANNSADATLVGALAQTAGTALGVLSSPGSVFQSHGWHVLNNAWNSASLKHGVDYQLSGSYNPGDVTGGTTFTWSYPEVATAPGQLNTIRAYPEVIFGPSPYGGGSNVLDKAVVFPAKVGSLAALEAQYDVSFSGDRKGFNVAFDIWFTSVPNGNETTITNEVMVWLHQGDFEPFGERVGTYVDGAFAATIYHDAASNYTAVVANADSTAGTLDVVKMIGTLKQLNILTDAEYLASIELGAEVVGGKGSLTINNLDLRVSTTNADGSWTTKVVTGSSTETIIETPPADEGLPLVAGSSANDELVGSTAADRIEGKAGNDVLVGLAGKDVLLGGTGDDLYIVDDAGDVVCELTGSGNDTVITSTSYALAARSSVERLMTSDSRGVANINLTGNELANYLSGNAGANRLDGGAGADTLLGGKGDDVYVVDNNGDWIQEIAGCGNDTVLTSIDWSLSQSQELENLSAASLTSTSALTLNGNDLANIITGNNGANTLNGGGGKDRLFGNGGNDRLSGNAGADEMHGGTGDDLYFVDDWHDRVVEEASQGTDTVLTSVSYALAAGQAVEKLQAQNSAGTTAINLTGNELANYLSGNAGANRLDGGAGADVLNGGLGDDSYIVDDSGDWVQESAGGGTDTVRARINWSLSGSQEIEQLIADDASGADALVLYGNQFANRVIGNAGANTLGGMDGNDTLRGLGGDDRISGGNGNDVIVGGLGRDLLHGNAGADRFVFETLEDSGRTAVSADVIHDFNRAEGDRIDLSALDANTGLAGNQAFTFFDARPAAPTAGSLWAAGADQDWTLYGDVDGDGTADFAIAVRSTARGVFEAGDLIL